MTISNVRNRTTTTPRAAGARERLPKINADRALVPVQPVAAVDMSSAEARDHAASDLSLRNNASARPSAFLAHLVATRDQVPQTRMRNRVEPAEAISVYRAAMRAQPGATHPAIHEI